MVDKTFLKTYWGLPKVFCAENLKNIWNVLKVRWFLYHGDFVVQVNSHEYDEDFVLISLKKSLNVWTSDLMTVILVDFLKVN